jgi:hypothetical protein
MRRNVVSQFAWKIIFRAIQISFTVTLYSLTTAKRKRPTHRDGNDGQAKKGVAHLLESHVKGQCRVKITQLNFSSSRFKE